jgi:hypothetical protein
MARAAFGIRLRAAAVTATAALVVAVGFPSNARARGVVSGELRRWHAVAVTFDGPASAEDATPNPFLDYRLVVTFEHVASGRQFAVPGFFAADGNAGESGAEAGSKWRALFAPDDTGEWSYAASFREGPGVAVELAPRAGTACAFDGARGSFTVRETDKRGRDHRGRGCLEYVGEHYLRFEGTGEFFIKGGADSPENFLAYHEFDGTSRHGNLKERRGEARTDRLHRYAPHVRDWRRGDPTWRGGRGRGIIGALNYLSAKGMNSVYFLTMNVTGDGKDVWPWTSAAERRRFDCSKLDQWEVVLTHMDRVGLMLHVITQETENDQLLDGGALGNTRRLYYRELVARFAHHLAVVWNLGEENTNSGAERKDFARYVRALDPYDHPIVVHTYPGRYDRVYGPLLGCVDFEGPSLQMGNMKATHSETAKWVERSARAGRRWFVSLDEIGPANAGVKPDADDPSHRGVRRHALWGNLMAGGAGCEWYFGYRFAHNDLNCEDWRSRDAMWDQTRHAIELFRGHLPFTRMHSADELTSAGDDYCFATPGEVYAVYLPGGVSTELDLGAMPRTYDVTWYDPRAGGALQLGSVESVSGPGTRSIGRPPRDADMDWVVLVQVAGDLERHMLEVAGGIGDGEFAEGARVRISALAPEAGRAFDRWTGDTAALADASAPATTVTMPARDVTVTATWRDGADAGEAGPPPPGNAAAVIAVTSFTLMNADTDAPVPGHDPLADGARIELARLPSRGLNVRANVSAGAVGSVRFALDGDARYHSENSAPFALAGDAGGDYGEWTPAPGRHTLTATPYAEPNCGGAAGKALTIRFTVAE